LFGNSGFKSFGRRGGRGALAPGFGAAPVVVGVVAGGGVVCVAPEPGVTSPLGRGVGEASFIVVVFAATCTGLRMLPASRFCLLGVVETTEPFWMDDQNCSPIGVRRAVSPGLS
jgi:hypothetical protein